MKPWYADDLLWKVMGFGFAVFVFPAVCILVARDIVRRYRRDRSEKSQQVDGFDVRLTDQPPSPDDAPTTRAGDDAGPTLRRGHGGPTVAGMRGGEFIRVPGDGSARVTWKNFPVIVVFVAVLILLTTTQGRTHLVAVRVLAGAAYAFAAVVVLVVAFFWVRIIRLKRHPAFRVGRLLAGGRTAEALELGRKLLEQMPGDPLVRINVTSALEAAGQREEARRVFDGIAAEGLPKYIRPAHEHWQRVLGRP
jgi:hypothetical protein